MGDMFTSKEILTYVLGALLAISLMVWRKFEGDTKARIKAHGEHLTKIDEALHRLELAQLEQRLTQAETKELKSDIREIETRMMRLEQVLVRIEERLGGNRRRNDPNPEELSL